MQMDLSCRSNLNYDYRFNSHASHWRIAGDRLRRCNFPERTTTRSCSCIVLLCPFRQRIPLCGDYTRSKLSGDRARFRSNDRTDLALGQRRTSQRLGRCCHGRTYGMDSAQLRREHRAFGTANVKTCCRLCSVVGALASSCYWYLRRLMDVSAQAKSCSQFNARIFHIRCLLDRFCRTRDFFWSQSDILLFSSRYIFLSVACTSWSFRVRITQE